MFPSTFEWFGFPIFWFWFWACNLMKVIPVTCHARTCWMLFQKHVMHVPVEGYSRNISCTYLMKVIPETCHARTWWRLFQKHFMHVPDEGYSRNTHWIWYLCFYFVRMNSRSLKYEMRREVHLEQNIFTICYFIQDLPKWCQWRWYNIRLEINDNIFVSPLSFDNRFLKCKTASVV